MTYRTDPVRVGDLEVSGELATQLLARAAELDAEGGTGARLSQLREAAREAGISPSAFERAVSELVAPPAVTLEGPEGRREAGRTRRIRILVAAATGMIVVVIAVRLLNLLIAP